MHHIIYFKRLYIFLIFVLFTCRLASQNIGQVIIKPNSHTALINDIAKVPGKNLVLTSSFDKTIKIWNTTTAAYEDELLGEIGGEGLGTYLKIEVTPNGKKVAAACIAYPVEEMNVGTYLGIRVFDIETRKMEKLIAIDGGEVKGMEFINNGELLALASSSFIYFIDANTWKISDTIEAPINEQITKTLYFKNKYYFITEGGVLYNYDFITKESSIVYNFKTDIWAITGNENTGTIAIATATGDIKLLDLTFQATSIIHSTDYPISLAFSPNGKQLLVGYYNTTSGCSYYNIEGQKLRLISSLKDQIGLVGTVVFYENNKAITAGGGRNSVDFWELSIIDTAKLLNSCVSNTLPIMAACEYGGALAFSTNLTFDDNTFPYRWLFHLSRHQAMPIVPFGTLLYLLPKPVIKQEDLELNAAEGTNGGTAVKITNNGKAFNTLSGVDAVSYTFLPNKHIAVGGRKGQLRVYDIYGMEVADLVGHNDMVTSLTINASGDYLISSSKDGTIKFWNLKKLFYYDPFNSTPAEEIDDPDFKEKVKAWGLEIEMNEKYTLSWLAIIKACFNNNESAWGDKLFQKLAFLKKLYLNHVKADMNIFISNDNEWVFWDKDNYYSGSKAGCKTIGFHINQGINKEAKFYPFEQFDLTNNRPDIIYKFFDKYDTATIQAYHNAYLKRLKNLNLNPNKMKNDGRLPQLKLMNVSGSTAEPQLQLNFSAVDSFNVLSKIMITVNDVPVYGSGGKNIESLNKKEFSTDKQKGILPFLDLSKGKNKIQVSVLNQNGVESLRETFVIQYNPTITKKPNLYIVTIGVSNYKKPEYNLTYAGKDAGDIAKAFGAQSSRFDSVFTMSLINENVTKSNIIKLKQSLFKSKVDDQVIIFLAGHGLLSKDFNFYFATHDMDFNNPAASGISFSEIENLLDGIASRNKLLLMDACHSGEVDNSSDIDLSKLASPSNRTVPDGMKVTTYLKRSSELIETEEDNSKVGLKNSISVLSEMFYDLRRSSGAVVISAASAEGYALESASWHNGVFTYAVLSGLQNYEADLNKDSQIVVSELKDYILKQVEILTAGKQQPTIRRENSGNDFRVW